MADRNVNHSTTDSSHAPRVPDPVQQNRPENGTELLPEHNGVPSATNVQRLAEIRARLDAATPGPWSLDFTSAVDVMEIVAADRTENGDVACVWGWPDEHEPRNNAEFIAHAPADIAWLLGEVERLRGEA